MSKSFRFDPRDNDGGDQQRRISKKALKQARRDRRNKIDAAFKELTQRDDEDGE